MGNYNLIIAGIIGSTITLFLTAIFDFIMTVRCELFGMRRSPNGGSLCSISSGCSMTKTIIRRTVTIGSISKQNSKARIVKWLVALTS